MTFYARLAWIHYSGFAHLYLLIIEFIAIYKSAMPPINNIGEKTHNNRPKTIA